MRTNQRFPQCQDIHDHWCPNCLGYIGAEHFPERHHLIPDAALRGNAFRDVLGSATDLLRRKLRFCRDCHVQVQLWSDLIAGEISNHFERGNATKLAFALDRDGLFEVSAAIHYAALVHARAVQREIKGAANNYLFSAGGAVHSTHQALESLWKFTCEKKDVALALTLAGPAINSGHVKLARQIIENVELHLGIRSQRSPATLRRRSMLSLDPKQAISAFELSAGTGMWPETTARVLLSASLIGPQSESLAKGAEHMNGLFEFDPGKIVPLESRLRGSKGTISIFHLACGLVAAGHWHYLQKEWLNALSYYYQAQFLRAVLGLRVLPTWKVWESSPQVAVCDLSIPINACIQALHAPAEWCHAIRDESVGCSALRFACSRLLDIIVFCDR